MTDNLTPGPWIVAGPDDAVWVSTEDRRTTIPANVADARLIAAAPDLLAALVEVYHSTALQGAPCGLVAQVRDAIEEATS